MSDLDERDGDGDAGFAVGRGVKVYGPVVSSSDGLSNAKPEAAALHGCAVRRVATEESLEDPRSHFRREHRSGVGDLEYPVAFFGTENESDGASAMIVLHCVVGEIQEELAKSHPIPSHSGRIAFSHRGGNTFGSSKDRNVFHQIIHQLM